VARPRRVSATGVHQRIEGTLLEAVLGGSDSLPAASLAAVRADERPPEHGAPVAPVRPEAAESQALTDATAEREALRHALAQAQAAHAADQARWAQERQRLEDALRQATTNRASPPRRRKMTYDPYSGTIAEVATTVARASNIQLAEESLKVIEAIQRDCQEWVGQALSLFEITNLALLWLGVSLARRDPAALQAALAPYRGRLKPRSLGPVLRVLWQHLLGVD
jgi:hypothetical protein